MSFANPMFFWGLLSLIPLIAIYFLKVRPQRKPTTAYFLWQQVLQENRAQSLFQRFRDFFSLLVLALVFAAVVIATARPYITDDQRKDLVLLIDNTASMNATAGLASTRLEQAKSVAKDIVRSLNGVQRCTIATVAQSIHFRSNVSDNPKELIDAIDSIEPGVMAFQAGTWDTLIGRPGASAQPLHEDQRSLTGSAPLENPESQRDSLDAHPYRVVLISDGCFDKPLPAEIELLRVGNETAGNVGIVAADLQRLPGSEDRVAFFVQVASTCQKAIQADLVLREQATNQLVKIIPLELEPGINPPEMFQVDNLSSHLWILTIEYPDSLAEDNSAYVTLPKKQPISVGVRATDPFFYENSVIAFGAEENLLKLTDLETAKLVIGQGDVTVDQFPARTDLLIFNPTGPSPWWNDLSEEFVVQLPRVVDDNLPVMRHLDGTMISYVGAKRLKAPPGSEVWVVAEDNTPLVYRTTQAGRHVVVVNLDPLASEFFLSPWFPVLVYSTATHLTGRTELQRNIYATGETVPIFGYQEGSVTHWKTPRAEELKITEANSAPLGQLGFYELKNANGEWQIGSSLLAKAETMLDNGRLVDNSQAISRGWSPVVWLTGLALVLAAGESMLYQRRLVG